jgi:hypothetical protein
MTVSNAFDPIERPANVSLLQERGLSRYRPLSNIILPLPVSFAGRILRCACFAERHMRGSTRVRRHARRHALQTCVQHAPDRTRYPANRAGHRRHPCVDYSASPKRFKCLPALRVGEPLLSLPNGRVIAAPGGIAVRDDAENLVPSWRNPPGPRDAGTSVLNRVRVRRPA